MSLRTAVADDLAAIMRLERATFPTDAWSEPMLRDEIASPHGRYVVDVEAGRLLGYGGVRSVAGAPDADIQTIAVAAEARGRGRGRALLRELLATALGRGATSVFLEVRDDNPNATALYVSEGFAVIGRRARYYQPDDIDAIVMKLDVRGWAAANDIVAPGATGVGPVGAAPSAGPTATGTASAAGGDPAKGWC